MSSFPTAEVRYNDAIYIYDATQKVWLGGRTTKDCNGPTQMSSYTTDQSKADQYVILDKNATAPLGADGKYEPVQYGQTIILKAVQDGRLWAADCGRLYLRPSSDRHQQGFWWQFQAASKASGNIVAYSVSAAGKATDAPNTIVIYNEHYKKPIRAHQNFFQKTDDKTEDEFEIYLARSIPAGCTSSSDCPTGQVCVNGVCQTPPAQCSSTKPCPTGQMCVGGVCVNKPPPPPQCSKDNPCRAGYECVGGVCKKTPNPPAQCSRTRNCPAGYKCVSGVCQQEKPSQCSASNPCPVDFTCDTSGKCVPTIIPIQPCSASNPCPAGYTCDSSGSCQPTVNPVTPCSATAPCPAGYTCSSSGSCEPVTPPPDDKWKTWLIYGGIALGVLVVLVLVASLLRPRRSK